MSVASVRTIPLSQPWLDEREEELVVEVLRSGRLSLGPTIDRFEEPFAEAVGAPYAAAVSSGTAGLHLLCVAAGVGPGDEVITSPYSFVASANCAIYEGATPVFADIDPRTLNLDPGSCRGGDHRRARGPSSPSTSTAIRASSTSCGRSATRHGIALIDDACEALGARYKGARSARTAPSAVVRLLPEQADHDRRGRHRHDPLRGRVAAAPEPSQPGSRRLRRLARARTARLQLPDRRHPCRDRPRPAREARRDPRARARAVAERYGELLAGIDGARAPARGRRRPRAVVVRLRRRASRRHGSRGRDRDARRARRPDRALPPVHPPAAVHAGALRLPRGSLSGRRGDQRANARASVPRATRRGRSGVRRGRAPRSARSSGSRALAGRGPRHLGAVGPHRPVRDRRRTAGSIRARPTTCPGTASRAGSVVR